LQAGQVVAAVAELQATQVGGDRAVVVLCCAVLSRAVLCYAAISEAVLFYWLIMLNGGVVLLLLQLADALSTVMLSVL
jgi:hypothetical protein